MRQGMAAVLAVLMILACGAMLTGCGQEQERTVWTYGDDMAALGRDLRDGQG